MKKIRFNTPLRIMFARFFVKTSRWILPFVLTVLIVAMFFVPSLVGQQKESAYFAVIGTLVGAVASYLATTQVQKEQIKANIAIAKKDRIYIPLYNELLETKEILEALPYPSMFLFRPGDRRANPFPRFQVWQTIQEDERRFQVPDWLRKTLDNYRLLAERYLSIRGQAENEVMTVMVRAFKEEYNVDFRCSDIAHILFPMVVNQEDLGETILARNHSDNRLNPQIFLSSDDIRRLETLIYNQCANLASIHETKAAYKEIVDATGKLAHTLRNAIDFIIDRFESDEQAF